MAALKKESELYQKLSDLFDENKDNITLDVYKSAIEIAQKYEKEEIQFVLFKLKYVHSDVKTGIIILDKIIHMAVKMISCLTRIPYKLAFVRSVLKAV